MWFCCLKPQNEEQLVPKLYLEGDLTEGKSHTLLKEDIQGVGKATDDDGTYSWHDLLAKTEPMRSYRRKFPRFHESACSHHS